MKNFENRSRMALNTPLAAVAGVLLSLPTAGWAGGTVTQCTEAALRSALSFG